MISRWVRAFGIMAAERALFRRRAPRPVIPNLVLLIAVSILVAILLGALLAWLMFACYQWLLAEQVPSHLAAGYCAALIGIVVLLTLLGVVAANNNFRRALELKRKAEAPLFGYLEPIIDAFVKGFERRPLNLYAFFMLCLNIPCRLLIT